MKEQQGSGFQFIPREEEIGKCDLLCKIRTRREEIISLKECRTPLTEKDTQDHTKWNLTTMSFIAYLIIGCLRKNSAPFPPDTTLPILLGKTTLTCYTSPAIFTYFYNKLRFWKRRRNDAVTNRTLPRRRTTLPQRPALRFQPSR